MCYTYSVSTFYSGGVELREEYETGNSMVVSIPKDMLAQIGMVEGTEVDRELDRKNQRIIIKPNLSVVMGVDKEFAHQLDQFIDQYRTALEALAK